MNLGMKWVYFSWICFPDVLNKIIKSIFVGLVGRGDAYHLIILILAVNRIMANFIMFCSVKPIESKMIMKFSLTKEPFTNIA